MSYLTLKSTALVETTNNYLAHFEIPCFVKVGDNYSSLTSMALLRRWIIFDAEIYLFVNSEDNCSTLKSTALWRWMTVICRWRPLLGQDEGQLFRRQKWTTVIWRSDPFFFFKDEWQLLDTHNHISYFVKTKDNNWTLTSTAESKCRAIISTLRSTSLLRC